jgi:Matrixin
MDDISSLDGVEFLEGCAVPDRPSSVWLNKHGYTSNGKPCAWPGNRVTWWLDNTPQGWDRGSCELTIARAFAVWTNACSLRAERAANADQALVRIAFLSKAQCPELVSSTGAIRSAFAFFPCADQASRRGQVVFNSSVGWGDDRPAAPSADSKLFRFAVHEIGHAIGIAVHGNPTRDAMQNDPTGWPGTLTENDRNLIRNVYPEEGDPNGPFV